MLILQFQAGANAYAVDCRRVVEVVPRVQMRTLPHAPAWLAGMLHYRGPVVPVIDMGRLFGAAASADRLSTRIILADTSSDPKSRSLIGLMAERVSELQRVADPEHGAPVALAATPYLGPILETKHGLVQMVLVEHLCGTTLAQLSGSPLQEQR